MDLRTRRDVIIFGKPNHEECWNKTKDLQRELKGMKVGSSKGASSSGAMIARASHNEKEVTFFCPYIA